MHKLQPFSETLTTGSIPSYETNRSYEIYASEITMKHLQRHGGDRLYDKVQLYFNRANITGDRKNWIESQIITKWKKIEKDLPAATSDKYNQTLLDFLVYHDNEYLLNKILQGKEPIPPELRKHLKEQKEQLVEKRVKERKAVIPSGFPVSLYRALKTKERSLKKEIKDKGKIKSAQIALANFVGDFIERAKRSDKIYPMAMMDAIETRQKNLIKTAKARADADKKTFDNKLKEFKDWLIGNSIKELASKALSRIEQEKIYALPGVIPTWWDPFTKKGSYIYHAARAIKRTGASARDVKIAVEKGASGKTLSPKEMEILVEGWGILGGAKILKGEIPVKEQLQSLYGEFYHRDVGWY